MPQTQVQGQQDTSQAAQGLVTALGGTSTVGAPAQSQEAAQMAAAEASYDTVTPAQETGEAIGDAVDPYIPSVPDLTAPPVSELPSIEPDSIPTEVGSAEQEALTVVTYDPDTQTTEVVPQDEPTTIITPAKGTSQFAGILREVGRNERQLYSATNTYEEADERQRKPLNQRYTIQDYQRTTIQGYDPKTDTYTVDSQTIGGIANGTSVGRGKKKRHTVTGKNIQSGVQAVGNYVTQSPNMSYGDRIFGLGDLYYNMVGNFHTGTTRDDWLAGRQTFGQIHNNFNLYQNWGRYNNFQRFDKTARGLLDNGRLIMGDEWYKNLVGTTQNPTGYGAALNGIGLLNFGYSAFQLLDNWADMNQQQRVGAVINTLSSGVNAMQSAEAIGNYLSSTTGAGAAGAGAAGAGAAGQGAAGAGQGAAGAGQGAAGAGQGAAGAGQGAAGAGTTAPTSGFQATQQGQFAGYLQTAAALYAAYQIVDQWGTGGAEGRAAGAANGATIGTYFLPGWGTLIGAAVGLAIGSIKTGKHVGQTKRDYYRGHYEKNKVFEKQEGSNSHVLQLADGTYYDVGKDGKADDGNLNTAQFNGETKTFLNPHLIAERDKGAVAEGGVLRPYDIDYTSDLDFSTSLATKGLNLFMMGGSIDNTQMSEATQMNGYLTNAATSNLSGREFTEENFHGSMANVRQFYSKMGIDSKEQGIELASALLRDDRMSQDDYNAVMIGLEMAFTDDYQTAKGFMAEMGRGGDPAARTPDTTTMEEFKAQEAADKKVITDNTAAAKAERAREMASRWVKDD